MVNADTERVATPADAAPIAALINAAYVVEAFFKVGHRTSVEEILGLMRTGRFLVLDLDGRTAGCVYVEVNGAVGYFGMLSIDPALQKQGLGARLMRAAETLCRRAGCTEMELQVVNLRTELVPYYRKFGYTEQGTREFPESERTTRPCHFIVMRKPLQGPHPMNAT